MSLKSRFIISFIIITLIVAVEIYMQHALKQATEEEGDPEENVDSRLQVQLEEDGGDSSRQSWMESSGLWTMIHREQ